MEICCFDKQAKAVLFVYSRNFFFEIQKERLFLFVSKLAGQSTKKENENKRWGRVTLMHAAQQSIKKAWFQLKQSFVQDLNYYSELIILNSYTLENALVRKFEKKSALSTVGWKNTCIFVGWVRKNKGMTRKCFFNEKNSAWKKKFYEKKNTREILYCGVLNDMYTVFSLPQTLQKRWETDKLVHTTLKPSSRPGLQADKQVLTLHVKATLA